MHFHYPNNIIDWISSKYGVGAHINSSLASKKIGGLQDRYVTAKTIEALE